jgi:hypothetical protein
MNTNRPLWKERREKGEAIMTKQYTAPNVLPFLQAQFIFINIIVRADHNHNHNYMYEEHSTWQYMGNTITTNGGQKIQNLNSCFKSPLPGASSVAYELV